MLSKEYKENVMKRLKNMDAKELVNLLEEVGSTRNEKAPFRREPFLACGRRCYQVSFLSTNDLR